MKKTPRIVANLLLPPCVATLLLVIPVVLWGSIPPWKDVAMVMLYGYAFAAIPSAVHAIVMEQFYRRGLLPTQGRAIGASTGSGLFAGLFVAIILALASSFSRWKTLWVYPLLGAATGAIIAVVILVISHAQKKTPNQALGPMAPSGRG
jgi:hypothetical protein